MDIQNAIKSVETNENGELHFRTEPSDVAQASGENSTELEIKKINERIKDMDMETKKINDLKNELERNMTLEPPGNSMGLSLEEKNERDQRSVFVGNVDYGASEEELVRHFAHCGTIIKVTIRRNRLGPIGCAYIEFGSKEIMHKALALDKTMFRERQIKVMIKRTNLPGFRGPPRRPGGFRGMPRRFPRS